MVAATTAMSRALASPLTRAHRERLGRWWLQVNALFTRLAPAVTRMQLSPDDSQTLLDAALHAGALSLIPVLMRDAAQRSFDLSFGANPLLTDRAASPALHAVSLLPFLLLIEFGVDPSVTGDEALSSLSALQLARTFVRNHPAPAAAAIQPGAI